MLRDGSAAAAAEIRRIRAAYPETRMRPIRPTSGDFREMQVVRAANEPGHERLTWLKRVAYHLTGRAVHPTGMVVAGDAHWWHVSTFERAYRHGHVRAGHAGAHPRPGAGAGAGEARRARSLGRLVDRAARGARRYRAEMGRLTSRENWARLYGLDE